MSLTISIPANAFPQVHTVTFFENASETDSATAFETGTTAQTLTLVQNMSPAFTDAGFTFDGWNTAADGSGVTYADGSSYSFSADIGLYAQWVAIPVVRTVTFYENASPLDLLSAFASESAPTQLTLFGSLQPTFSNSGHIFSGWNTEADGSGVTFADGSTYSFALNVSLYAQWTVAVAYTVTFNENDTTTDSLNSLMSKSSLTRLTLFAKLQPSFSNGSHTFSDWNTSRDGSGTSYSDGAQFPFNNDLVLYAQWSLISPDIFTFSANGGNGIVASISGSPGTILTIPGQAGLIRTGFALTNWNTSANGSGSKYLVGEKVTMSGSVHLYAQWSGHVPATLFGAIGTFKKDSSTLSAALKNQINRIAVTIKSRKYSKISLFGYTSATGLKTLNVILSRTRARNVASYLRNRLHNLKVRGVTVSSTGEGAIAGQSSNSYSRVEIFGV